ncbi:MAG: geranylgeranylglycerol-phosphate geranylgeranyltransferase [Bacteroidota bacterium]
MKLIGAFFRLVRWPNLVFIFLTQALFYFCVYVPLFGAGHILKLIYFIAASVLIAAAGYIINDYFDLNIDQINKPGKNVFAKTIHRRWAIILHLVLSFAGIVFTVLAAGVSKWYLIVANLFCIALLWLYSTSLKRSLLVGNVVTSLLTAWTVLIIFFGFTEPADAIMTSNPTAVRFFRIAFMYAGFAFVLSLVREAVKDMEDLDGDARYGCRTLPIVAGTRTTKMYALVWMVVLIASLLVLQLYILLFGWWYALVYLFLMVLLPLIYTARQILRSATTKQFAYISQLTKWIMFTGILSMIFFRIYF